MTSFEDALLKACADQFFSSSPSHTTTDQNGITNTYYVPSPALSLAKNLFDAKRDEIMTLVMEKLNLDVVAEKLSKSVLAALTAEAPANSWGHDPYRALRERIQAAFVDKVATDMAEEVKKKLSTPVDIDVITQSVQPKEM